MKEKSTTAVLAFCLGGLGAHRFYLGHTVLGVAYLVFCWTFIPAILGAIEGIYFLSMSDEVFFEKYNGVDPLVLLARSRQNPTVQSQTINVQVSAGAGSGDSAAHQITKLYELRQSGALTEEEFTAEKAKILTRPS